MVIGGGVVGCSVLYHLTEAGWTDVMLVERLELAAGSSWHAAGDIHTHNGNVYLADLQRYTVELYPELERASGQDCGIHMTGGLQLANSPEWMDWLKMVHAPRALPWDGHRAHLCPGGGRVVPAHGSFALRWCHVDSSGRPCGSRWSD